MYINVFWLRGDCCCGVNSISEHFAQSMVFNLIGDPGERFNLWEVSMDMAWVMHPALEQIAQFQQSVARYPNIATGADFKGYT